MKAAILLEQNKPIVVGHVDVPKELKYGQVLVKILFSGVCRSQLMELEGGRGGFGSSVEIPSGTLAPGLYVIHLEARSRIDNDSGIGRDIQIRIH